jgi:hypothetical protein
VFDVIGEESGPGHIRPFRWRKPSDTGVHATLEDLAKAKGVAPSYVSRVLRLTLLAPEIVVAILDWRPAGAAAGSSAGMIFERRRSDPINGTAVLVVADYALLGLDRRGTLDSLAILVVANDLLLRLGLRRSKAVRVLRSSECAEPGPNCRCDILPRASTDLVAEYATCGSAA